VRPPVDQLVALLHGGALEHALPLRARPRTITRAQPQAEQGDGWRRVRGTGRRLPGDAVLLLRRFRELYHDAHRLLGMQERLLPLGMDVLVADDPVAERFRPSAGFAKGRHLEGHVVDAGAVLCEKAVEKPVLPVRLENLDAPTPVEAPLAEAKELGRQAEVRLGPQLTHENGGRGGEVGDRDCDVIERDVGHRSSVRYWACRPSPSST
jgi:hypothetical protein